MRKLLLTLVMGLSLTLVSGLAIAQHTHGAQKSDTLKVGKSPQMMMSMQEKMTQENSHPRRMMADSAKKCDMMGKKMMGKGKMGGKMMMQGQMGKGMMQGHMGKAMMQGKMGSGMNEMGMNDPVMMTLHTAGCPGYLLKVSDKLELSASQKAQFDALKTNFKKFAVKKNADIKVAKIELNELLGNEKFDSKKIKSQISKIESLQSDLRVEMLKTIEKSRSFLRQDQLNKLKELRNDSGMGTCTMKHNMMK
ncbi:MAG: hypothetical protein GXO74_12775 [Calditrichaeota bacterium]|nr:hypothetical protein [Calditrichota bacterium]